MGFDPATLAIGSMVLSGGSALVQAGAARQEGKAAQAQSNYQAQVAENNRKQAEQNATLAEAAGSAEEAQQGMRNRATIGAIKAGQSASGVDINVGSPVDVRSSAAELGSLDQNTIRSNAARESYGFRSQAANFGSEAQLHRGAGKQAAKAGNLAAFSSILSGASSIGGTASRAKKAGIF